MGAISIYTVHVNHKSHIQGFMVQGGGGGGDKFSIHPPPLNKSLHVHFIWQKDGRIKSAYEARGATST